LEIIKDLWDGGEREQAADYLQYLEYHRLDTSALSRLFEVLIDFCSPTLDPSQAIEKAVLTHRVYESLIIAGARAGETEDHSLLHHYLRLQDVHLAKRGREEPLVKLLPFEELRAAVQQDSSSVSYRQEPLELAKRTFWEGVYSLVAATGQHFLSLVVTEAIRLIKEKAFEELLLVLFPFPELKPLVFLLAWDIYAGDIPARKSIIDLLWTSIDQVGEMFFFFVLPPSSIKFACLLDSVLTSPRTYPIYGRITWMIRLPSNAHC